MHEETLLVQDVGEFCSLGFIAMQQPEQQWRAHKKGLRQRQEMQQKVGKKKTLNSQIPACSLQKKNQREKTVESLTLFGASLVEN